MTATEQVILVNERDEPIGTAEKLHAHRENLCHRAFSVFILNKESPPKLLLQQRAASKYHSPLLWTNTCCSHPRPNEGVIEAGERRLQEEMGMTASLRSLGSFHYIAHFDNGLVENEIDHVLVGYLNGAINPNPEEVASYRWVTLAELKHELAESPEQFTPWLPQVVNLVEEYC